jgi:hypothetical protein
MDEVMLMVGDLVDKANVPLWGDRGMSIAHNGMRGSVGVAPS